MGLRGLNTYSIRERRAFQMDSVSTADMVLDLTSTSAAAVLPAGALPYCVDMARERVVFTVHDAEGLARVGEAAFMFGAQLESAVEAASVPFERLEELGEVPKPAPLLVFSPGRTGSTLLVRLLSAAGVACASEPDVLTQLAREPQTSFRLLPRDTRMQIARGCLAGLAREMGAGLCVKLRSQSNGRPLLLVDAAPGCRVVFMLRGFRSWAASRHRSFAEPPEMVASILRQAMDALDKLLFADADVSVLWFETLAEHPAAALRACAPNLVWDVHAVGAVMQLDSQAGTILAREAVAALPAPEMDGFFAAFAGAWAEARAGAEWQERTEGYLAEMFAT